MQFVCLRGGHVRTGVQVEQRLATGTDDTLERVRVQREMGGEGGRVLHGASEVRCFLGSSKVGAAEIEQVEGIGA